MAASAVPCARGAASPGFRTATTKSADSNADGTDVAPVSWYSASEKKDSSPAPASTRTSTPLFTSRDTAFGVRATRRSPSADSFGTPTITWVFLRPASLYLSPAGGEIEEVTGGVYSCGSTTTWRWSPRPTLTVVTFGSLASVRWTMRRSLGGMGSRVIGRPPSATRCATRLARLRSEL